MLFCNNVRIDLQKDEGIHKWVKERINKIIAENKLNKGGMVTIDYVKSLIKVDPISKKKKKPASIGIDFYEKMFNDHKDFQELQEWRYCESFTERPGKKSLYYPSGLTLSGSRNLGFKDVELIFFLKHISSRVEGNANSSGKTKKYIRFEDKFKEAEDWRREEQTKAYIKNCIIADPMNGGLADKDIRNIAAGLVMANARNENYPISMLRREIYDLVTLNPASHQKVAELIGTVNGVAVETMGNIAEAKELRLIDVKKISNQPNWVYLKKDGSTAAKIVRIPAGTMNDEEFLRDWLLANPEENKYFVESLVAVKGLGK